MKSIRLKFYHPDFDLLSDRSVRQFLKRVSTEVRDAQLSVAREFVLESGLDYSLQRSILDRLDSASQAVPAYYVDRIRRGSLEAVLVISAGVIGAMLYGSALDALNDAERQTMLRRLKGLLRGSWRPELVDEIVDRLEKRELVNHVVVEDIDVVDRRSGIVIDVTLGTLESDGDDVRRDYTLDTVNRELARRVDDGRRGR